MMEVVRTSETSVIIYFTTWQYISEDSELEMSCSPNNVIHGQHSL
jgi:hypothetical protein